MLKGLIASVILLSTLLITACNSQDLTHAANGRVNEPVSAPNEEVLRTDLATVGDTVSGVGDRILVIFQDRKNNYWFGGNDQGVYKYDGKNFILFTQEDGLCSPSVLGIQEDKSGNIYFDTTEGVCKFDGEKFTTLEILESQSSQNEWVLNPDDLWFRMGWDKGGPHRFDGEFLIPLEFPKTEQADIFYAKYPKVSFNPYGIYSLYKDRKGVVWFGTSSLGVCRYDGKSISWLYEDQMTTIPDGGALGIRSILEDKNGIYWFTNTRYSYDILPGSTKRNGTNYINYRKKEGIGYLKENGEIDFPYFMSITEDHEGDLWMATYADGVWRNNGKELIHYTIKDDQKDVTLFSIYKDRQGQLWLATHNAGVYKYNGSGFEKFKG